MDRHVTWAAAAGAILRGDRRRRRLQRGCFAWAGDEPGAGELPAGAVVAVWLVSAVGFWHRVRAVLSRPVLVPGAADVLGRGISQAAMAGWRPDGAPPALEAWHRRVHERMDGQAAAPKS